MYPPSNTGAANVPASIQLSGKPKNQALRSAVTQRTNKAPASSRKSGLFLFGRQLGGELAVL